jgi:hypothetical protein
MVASTLAAVSGERRRDRLILAGWHLAGLLVGAVTLALAVSLVAAVVPLPRTALAVAVAVAALVWGGASLLGRPLPVASSTAQVPRVWQYMLSPRQYIFSYGVGLGVGFLTRILSLSFYVSLALLLLARNPFGAVAVSSAYALARGAPVIVAAAGRSSAETMLEKSERVRLLALRIDSLALVAIGVLLVAAI